MFQIRGKDFKMEKLPIETCRQFFFEDIVLRDTSLNPSDHDIAKKVEAYCTEKVECLLEKAGKGAYDQGIFCLSLGAEF